MIGGRVLAALNDGSGVDGTIKSGSEVIECFSEFERAGAGQLVRWADTDSSCPIALHVRDNSIGVFFEPVFPKFPEGFAVGLCSFDTIPAALKW